MAKERSKFFILVPIILYLIFSVFVSMAARSQQILMIGDNALPVSSFAGVISTIANTVLVSMVVMYHKRGLIISTILLLTQLPVFMIQIFRNHNMATLPGIFSSAFTVIMFIIIYQNHVKMVNEQKRQEELFEQTATALVNAIDAKDTYTQGHSSRVAQYSRKLAEMSFKTEKECEEIYYAALLHDVGKIGISEDIITKKGKLTDEEYEIIKKHSELGTQILQSITEFPYLSVGAAGHHERYDGKGYPQGLKGTDIPEIARIVAVADAYDAMTSKRSYRDPIPQQIVREEIVKGAGSQFDPKYAKLMLRLIDVDTGFKMRERLEVKEIAGNNELVIGKHRSVVSEGILINKSMTSIRVSVSSTELLPGRTAAPSMILFDSLDERVHDTDKEINNLNYFEYCELWLNGETAITGARDIKTTKSDIGESTEKQKKREYKIEAVRIKDHALIRIIGEKESIEHIIALPDSARYAYIGLTGEHCRIDIESIDKADTESPEDLIPRIAEEISYINVPEGDMPNVQIDGYRTASSLGTRVRNGLNISFHTQSLPTARLVWHAPYIILFCGDEPKVNGANYHELAFVRFDGEAWECDPDCTLKAVVRMNENFRGWDSWKELNKIGYDASVAFVVESTKINLITENLGVSIRCEVHIPELNKPIYAAISGDQVAITNIHV